MWLCCQAVIPALRQRSGCIVNVAPVAARWRPAGTTAYSTPSSAVIALTKALAREFAGLASA
jgi:NAD(P)-dependent dehydrogenase (short-subunit alcohol dehydrogenase family)